jgi:hypothetical protein
LHNGKSILFVDRISHFRRRCVLGRNRVGIFPGIHANCVVTSSGHDIEEGRKTPALSDDVHGKRKPTLA